VLGDGGAAEVVQGLDGPVARMASARRVGLAWAAVGLAAAYTVTTTHAADRTTRQGRRLSPAQALVHRLY